MDVDIQVDGLREIETALRKLEAATAVKALNSALMAASKPTYDRARRNASPWPSMAGAIRRRKQRTIKRKTGKAQLQKGFRRGASPDRVTGVSIEVVHKKAPHFHLLELGTAQRKNKRGANRGRVVPRLMMTKAFEGGEDEAINIFKKRMKSRIKKLVKQGVL